MSSITTKLALPVVLLSALALSGCGGDDEGGKAADAPSTSQSSDTASATPSEDNPLPGNTDGASSDTASAAPAPGAEDATAPGTNLKLGEAAVVPVEYAGNKGTVEITVTAIRKGSAADLTKAGVKDAKGYVPFYIDYSMKLLTLNADTLGSYDGNSDLGGYIGTQRAGNLITFGDFAPCDSGGFEYDAKVGATAKACTPALAPNGTTVDNVQFTGGGTNSGYGISDGKPITWK